jgi:PAS domain S-box-containing protein
MTTPRGSASVLRTGVIAHLTAEQNGSPEWSEEMIRAMIVEDSSDDAKLVELELARAGDKVFAVRVASAAEMQQALTSGEWNVIIAAYSVPGFGALPALELLKQSGCDIPFIVLSGIISDEMAVAAMRAGAHDYLRKDNISRLLPAIEREIKEASTRRRKRQLEKILQLQVAALNSAANSIVITDREGNIEWINDAFTNMTGYSAAEAIGQNPRVLKSDKHDEQFYRDMWRTVLSGSAWHGEVTNRRKDGSLYLEEMTITPVRLEDGGISHFVAVKEDITARKHAEKALFRAGALQRAIFNSANFSSIATDANGIIQIFNMGAEQMLGYSAAEVMNKITPADISDPKEVVARAEALSLELGTPIKAGFEALVFKASRGIEDIYELTYVRKDGSRFPAMVSVTALRDTQYAIIGYLLIGTDNSARKLAEEALFRAGALQRAIFNSANFSSIATDASGVIQIFNVGAERMLGYKAADVMNKITPADISDSQEVIARAKALSLELGTTIKPGFEALVFKASRGIEDIYELTYVRKDGSRFPAMVSVTALRNAHNAIIGYLLIGTDNTARKQAEEALFKAGALQRAIFNSANFASIATDANGIIQIFNVGAERMLGYTARDVTNKITPADISDPQEVIERAKVLSRELGTPIKPGFEALVFKASRGIEDIYALTYVRKDGSRFPAMVSVTALRDAQETILGYLLIGTDNTERKQAEGALIRSEKLASVGRMAATIAHEINNPLSSALNALYLVRTDPALPECVKNHLILAEQELGRVAHITKQALGFFREVGNPTAVDVGEVFDSVLDIFGPRLRNKDVEVKRSYRSSTRIHAIDEEIRQVASNVIANSLDALSLGGKLHVRLFGPQALRGPRRMVRMTIADDGEGIAAENLKQICEPFFTTKQSVGTGLGLWVTSELVKKHEGRMRIKSQLGKGTVVSIWLPMERRGQDRRAA